MSTLGGRRPRWLFRVASSPRVGGGHMARCLSLAQAMADAAMIVFRLDRDGEAWLPVLRRAGIAGYADPADLPSGPWAGAVMDGYDLGEDEADILKGMVWSGPLVFIDDFCHPPSAADVVINSGCHIEGDTLGGKPALLGPRHALLAPEFRNVPARPVRDRVENILVSFGRVDSKNATCIALSALARLRKEGDGSRIEVVMASQAPHMEAVKRAVTDFPGPIELAVDADDMLARLTKADLAIGGGGISLFERMAAGVPSITVVQAENQAASTTGAAQRGATIEAGTVEGMDAEMLAASIAKTAADPVSRGQVSRAGRSLVDGYGAERVGRRLLEFGGGRRQ